MRRRTRVAVAAGAVAGGALLAVAIVFLRGQGLERADHWASVAGLFVSALLGTAGLVLAALTWRESRRQGRPAGTQTVDDTVVGGTVHHIASRPGTAQSVVRSGQRPAS